MRALFFLGVGICIGILVAPDKGSETRKKVADVMDDLKSKLKKKASEVESNLEDEFINQGSPSYRR